MPLRHNPGKSVYCTRKEVARTLGVHPSTIYRWAKADRFPAPIRLGPNRTVWKVSEVLEWMDTLEETRGFQEPA